MMDYRTEVTRDGIVSAPPVAAAGATMFGYPLSDALILLSIIWIGLQMGHWCYKRWKEWKNGDE